MYTAVKMQIQLCSVHPSIQHQQHSEEGVTDVCNVYWLCQLNAETRGSQAADAANAVGMSMRNELSSEFATLLQVLWPARYLLKIAGAHG